MVFKPLFSIKEYVVNWKTQLKQTIEIYGKTPSLFIIQVGNNEASNRYIRNKIKDCEEVGIKAELVSVPESTTTETICNYIDKAVEEDYSGIMVQLPIPATIDLDKIKEHIPVSKDVDGFRKDSLFMPCTPLGIFNYLDAAGFEFSGKHAVILGRSDIVGKPIAELLQDFNCTTTLCNSRTPIELRKSLLLRCDLVICAVGKRNFISSQDALNAFIVDVGINFDEDGKMCGDVNVNVVDKNRVTPVPGGVGLLTRCGLLQNVIGAALIEN